MQFDDLQLIEPLLRALHNEGYTTPSPIQEQAIPHVLAGRDLLGCAQTGTGKTAAFALPILQRLDANKLSGPRHIRVLVLAPTRELASQISDSFKTYGKFTRVVPITIFGGVGQNPQIDAIRRGADVLVATPGRLLDLLNQGYVKFDRLEVLVLDEADRMLDMGFIHDVRRIIATLPTRRQTLFFSATMPPDIQALADNILDNPVTVVVTPIASTVETIDQSVFFVEKSNKPMLLEHLLSDKAVRRVLIFTRTKHGANKVVKQLGEARIVAEAIHGNKSQSAREAALAHFKAGTTRVLVATDIAARGIDVDDITHVINYDLPNEPESYVHRIGRTGRAGMSGIALSFCDVEERVFLVDIERLIRKHVPRATNYPFPSNIAQPQLTDLTPRNNRAAAPRPQGSSRPQNRPQGQNGQNGQRRPNGQNGQNSQNSQNSQARQNGSGHPNDKPNPDRRRQSDRQRSAV